MTQKIATCVPLHNFVGLYLCNWGMYQQSEKKLVKQQYVLHMSTQYGELRPTDGWDWFGSMGHTSKFQRVSRLVFVAAATSRTGGQPNCTMFGRLLGWYTMYTFSGALAPWQKFAWCKIYFTSKSCILLYSQHYCKALQQQASAKLCCMVQGMELVTFAQGTTYSAGRPSHWALAHILVH